MHDHWELNSDHSDWEMNSECFFPSNSKLRSELFGISVLSQIEVPDLKIPIITS